MAFQSTEKFYKVSGGLIVSGPQGRPAGFGDASPDSTLAAYGWYRLWVDDGGAQPGPYYTKTPGPVVVDELSSPSRCTQTDVWTEFSPDEKRAVIARDIEIQVVDGGARVFVEDPLMERSIESTSGAAAERKSDLEDEPDANLDAFDPKIVPTPADGTGFIEAKMTTFIDEIEPWVGAPADDLALYVVLEIIRGGDPAAGASARADMYGPKDGQSGAVLPFTQDATNPNIWQCTSQVGRYWSDRAQTASMRLLWNSGSLPVAETKLLNGFGDKQSSVVRAPI